MLTVFFLALTLNERPTTLPLPPRPGGLIALVSEFSFASNFSFEKIANHVLVSGLGDAAPPARIKTGLVQNPGHKEIPVPILERLPFDPHDASLMAVIEGFWDWTRPYFPWFVPLLQRELWAGQFTENGTLCFNAEYKTNKIISYAITNQPDAVSADYVGSLTYFSFIRARGKTTLEVEQKLLQKYKDWLDDLAESDRAETSPEDDLPRHLPLIAKPDYDLRLRNRDLPARLFPTEIP